MGSPTNIQQSMQSLSGIPKTSHPIENKNGRFMSERFTVQINASSKLMDNAEEIGKHISEKKTKPRIKSTKKNNEKNIQKIIRPGAINNKSSIHDVSFFEEIGALIRLVKKINKEDNEDISDEDRKNMEYLLGGVSKDTNKIAEMMLSKIKEVVEQENGGGVRINSLKELGRMLNKANENNNKVEAEFWVKLNEIVISGKDNHFLSEEVSRKYSETLNAVKEKISTTYETNNILGPIAIEIKKIGHEIEQANNNPERFVILGKEMYLLQSLQTLYEHCVESEKKYERIFSSATNYEI